MDGARVDGDASVAMYSDLIGAIFLNLHFILFALVFFTAMYKSRALALVCTHGRRGKKKKANSTPPTAHCVEIKTVYGLVSGPALLLNDFQEAASHPTMPKS
jgi:hypothetical protein